MDDAPPGRLSGDQISTMDLPDWRSMHEWLEARFATGDFATGVRFVDRVAALAQAADHHPDVDLRATHVDVRLVSRDVYAKTQRDVDLARQVSAAAAELGLRAEPARVAWLEIGLDTWDVEEIRPFWQAVLGMTPHPRFDDDLRDFEGRLPTLWFQQSEPHDEPTQRFHLDLRLPPEVAPGRIEAALAAGGVLVSDAMAPRFTVLADPQGNKVCVCTQTGRSD